MRLLCDLLRFTVWDVARGSFEGVTRGVWMSPAGRLRALPVVFWISPAGCLRALPVVSLAGRFWLGGMITTLRKNRLVAENLEAKMVTEGRF